MMIAKNKTAYLKLCENLALRTIKRQYMAIVDGYTPADGEIDEPIGRSRYNRQKMTVCSSGKPAKTFWHTQRTLLGYSLIKLRLHTGRTHQIRVHMQFLSHPLLGDKTYGNHKGYKRYKDKTAIEIAAFPRQALHAYSLTLEQPSTKEILTIECDLPDDIKNILETMSKL